MMKIGQIETDGEPGRRDAFHVAAVLVKSASGVSGCQNVRFTDSSFTTVISSTHGNKHGIVDPFIGRAEPGQLFWVLLRPGLIKEKLTHYFELNIDDVPTVVPEEETEGEEDSCKGCW